jgi:hypothetical protein
MLITTMSPYPLFVKKTGSSVSWTVLVISDNLVSKSDTGHIIGIFFLKCIIHHHIGKIKVFPFWEQGTAGKYSLRYCSGNGKAKTGRNQTL